MKSLWESLLDTDKTLKSVVKDLVPITELIQIFLKYVKFIKYEETLKDHEEIGEVKTRYTVDYNDLSKNYPEIINRLQEFCKKYNGFVIKRNEYHSKNIAVENDSRQFFEIYTFGINYNKTAKIVITGSKKDVEFCKQLIDKKL